MSGKGFEKVIPVEGDLRRLDSGDSEEFLADLDLRGVPAGEYDVCVGVFEGDKPVKLAMKECVRKENGFYKITEVTVKKPVI